MHRVAELTVSDKIVEALMKVGQGCSWRDVIGGQQVSDSRIWFWRLYTGKYFLQLRKTGNLLDLRLIDAL